MNGHDKPVPDIDYDYLGEQAKIEQYEFDDAMMRHIRANNDAPCADPKCIFCGTYGQMMADSFGADEPGDYGAPVWNGITDPSIPF